MCWNPVYHSDFKQSKDSLYPEFKLAFNMEMIQILLKCTSYLQEISVYMKG